MHHHGSRKFPDWQENQARISVRSPYQDIINECCVPKGESPQCCACSIWFLAPHCDDTLPLLIPKCHEIWWHFWAAAGWNIPYKGTQDVYVQVQPWLNTWRHFHTHPMIKWWMMSVLRPADTRSDGWITGSTCLWRESTAERWLLFFAFRKQDAG